MSLAVVLLHLRPGLNLATTLLGMRNGAQVIEHWADPRPEPTAVEIAAATPAALAAADAKAIADAEDAARRDQAKQAYDALTNIRNGAQTVIDDPSVSNAEAVVYIKQLANAVQTLAHVEQHLIRALFGR